MGTAVMGTAAAASTAGAMATAGAINTAKAAIGTATAVKAATDIASVAKAIGTATRAAQAIRNSTAEAMSKAQAAQAVFQTGTLNNTSKPEMMTKAILRAADAAKTAEVIVGMANAAKAVVQGLAQHSQKGPGQE